MAEKVSRDLCRGLNVQGEADASNPGGGNALAGLLFQPLMLPRSVFGENLSHQEPGLFGTCSYLELLRGASHGAMGLAGFYCSSTVRDVTQSFRLIGGTISISIE
uniref:Uncharacterized protein n=1 Tax=Arundo donax TaxID=35708 RepID=A0A0A9S9C4_ARUDO